MAIRGKNNDEEHWRNVYMPKKNDTSTVKVSCTLGMEEPERKFSACDTFELGVISALDFDMYDVFIQVHGIEDFLQDD